ncbi:MAG: arsenite efflux transporter metallochaperone ArsD [Planctomycetota bacterium]|nr:arsenite efflux transporter metallochaperone ArsD [Planctomycetota bacterium]RLS36414.1 MAG: arsenical resistance operon transcriptional repressor ArsD [Planctomycetota bacterium]
MAMVQVFDKPMCCSTGVCGPKVDPVLPQFASDLAWLKDQGVKVERFNLAQQPEAFVAQPDVSTALQGGTDQALPLLKVNGKIVCKGIYPSRQLLAEWCGVLVQVAAPASGTKGGCCGGPKGCC